MKQSLGTLTRHPLHTSILESFEELRRAPSDKQASFTAILSRILSETFIQNDPDHRMPAFLTDAGVTIARFEIGDRLDQTPPGAEETIGNIIAKWHDILAQNPSNQAISTSGRFALCGAFNTLSDLVNNPSLNAGGVLAFFDPIYDDSLILIHMKVSSQAEWILRLPVDLDAV